MRIVSLNIRQGGRKRTAQLARWLVSKSPTVIVLPEYRDNAGRQLMEILKDSGFKTCEAMREKSERNSVLVAAIDLANSQDVTPLNSSAGNLMLIETADGVRVVGCYFPQSYAKSPFFRQCIQAAADNRDVPLVFIGDFNTGRNDLDIEGKGARFHCADLFMALSSEAGLVDLWRARHGDRQEWTWRSAVNGFRIDHAFGNEAFINRFSTFACDIDHEPRSLGFTDHSAVVVEAA